MIRAATVNDAEQLNILNIEFNGEDGADIENIKNSLLNNKQEIVIVAEENDILVGFVCVQLNLTNIDHIQGSAMLKVATDSDL